MSKEYDLNLKLGVEAFGTFALITTAMASKGHPAVNSSLLVILIIGLAGVSGGHWNPAATIANIINKSIDQKTGAYYIVAQLAGAAAAVYFFQKIFSEHVLKKL